MSAEDPITELPVRRPPSAEEVERHCPTARWSVEERSWHQIAPELSDDVTALLAPPVVVAAFS